MKKCPYCAEEIQYEAIICRHCGRDLTPPPLKTRTQTQGKKEPATGVSLLFGVLLLFAIYGFGFLIVSNYTGTSTDLFDTLRIYQVVCSIAVTLFAVPGLDPNKRGFWRYVGIFILSAIPIAGWIVLFWAGKGIARFLTQQPEPQQEPIPTPTPLWTAEPISTPAAITPISELIPTPQVPKNNSALFLAGGILLFIGFIIFASRSANSANTPVPTPRSTNQGVVPTFTPRPLSTPTHFPCNRWDKITAEMSGQETCVYGVVQELYSTNEAWTRITFTDSPDTFFLYSTLYVFEDLKVGDCISANGIVLSYGPIPYIETDDLYYCEPWMK